MYGILVQNAFPFGTIGNFTPRGMLLVTDCQGLLLYQTTIAGTQDDADGLPVTFMFTIRTKNKTGKNRIFRVVVAVKDSVGGSTMVRVIKPVIDDPQSCLGVDKEL